MAEAQPKVRNSRVGKRPVSIPKGVTVTLENGAVRVKGAKGELSRSFHSTVKIEKDGENLKIVPAQSSQGSSDRDFAKFQGLARAILANMIRGVSDGYKSTMDMYGVGYRATVSGQDLTLNLGLSHQVVHPLHPSVKVKVEIIDEGGTKRPRLHLESFDKEALGSTCSQIRSYRPPEPYKGKGVRFTGERVREKAGKAGGK